MCDQKSCNLIGGALYEALEQLHVLQVNIPSPTGVRGWLYETTATYGTTNYIY